MTSPTTPGPGDAAPRAGPLTGKLLDLAAGLDAQAEAVAARRAALDASIDGALPAPNQVDPSLAAKLADGGVKKSPAELAAESQRRTGYITAYLAELKRPTGNPDFASPALVFQAIAEERSYQQELIMQAVQAIRLLPPPASAFGLTPEEAEAIPDFQGLEARRTELDQLLAGARKRQTQMYTLMKRIAGVQGRTGGTDFLVDAEYAPPDYTKGVLDLGLSLDMQG